MTNRLKIVVSTLSCIGLSMATSYTFAAGSWVERIKINGDFRYRYELIDQETKEKRYRNRLRLRLGITAKVNDNVDIVAVLASGGEDPVSTNQTLDSQFTTKDLRLDQAHFAWKPFNGLTVKGGKFKNPFYKPVKSELLWDSDIRPEGLMANYSQNAFFANAGLLYLEERSKDDDSILAGGQVGYKSKMNGTKLTIGTGFFNYSEVKGHPLTDFDFMEIEDDSFGNTLNTDGNFVTDYKEWEVFGDVAFKLGAMPVALFADYVVNTAAEDTVSDADSGYLVGFKIGKVKAPGSWDFRYNYREVEADSVFATFADSDFGGGGTDGKGHEVNFGYQIAKGWKFALAYLMNIKGLENGQDYNRLQADLKFKF